jgi:hypothetical protein
MKAKWILKPSVFLVFVLAAILAQPVGAQSSPPANDNFANASVITTLPFSDTVDSTLATLETNEPQNCGTVSHTVWYSFTASTNMVVQADMLESSFSDTVISVYQANGPSLTDLAFIQCVHYAYPINLKVEEGKTYYIQAGNMDSNGGNLHLNLKELQPVTNDEANTAITIDALPYSNTQDVTNASRSLDDPTTCMNWNSVWFTFTPSHDAFIDVDTVGSNYLTALSVFTGEPGALVQVPNGCNEEAYGLQARVTFSAAAGTTYYIMIGGSPWDSNQLLLQLNMKEIIKPANDDFGNSQTVDALPFHDTVDINSATVETGEPNGCYQTSKTVWYAFTPAASVFVQVDLFGSSVQEIGFNIYEATTPDFSGLTRIQCAHNGEPAKIHVEAGTTYYIQGISTTYLDGEMNLNVQEITPPPNDNFADAEEITSVPFASIVDITNATAEQNEPVYCAYSPQTIWYKLTPSADATVQVNVQGSNFNTVLTFYHATDQGFDGLSVMNCIVDGRSINLKVEAGETYYIQAGSTYSSSGELNLSLEEITPPVNDDFDAAIVIPSTLPFDDTVDMTTASLQDGEPNSDCAWYGSLWKTVWYSYKPETTGMVTVNATSDFFSPVLTVYSGSSLSDLYAMGCQMYSGSATTFLAEAGKTYYFQVGKFTWWDPDGPMQFHIRMIVPPSNDNFSDAVVVHTLPFSDTVDITDATAEMDEPQPCFYLPQSVWYSFTPDAQTLVKLDMQGSSFGDTAFTVYQANGDTINDLRYLQCASFGSSALFKAQAGVTYYIQAGSFYGGGGTLQINLQEVPKPVNDDFANAKIIPEPLSFGDTVNTQAATREPNEPVPSCTYSGNGNHSVWYAFTPTTSESISANIPWATTWPVLAVYTGSSLSDLKEVKCENNAQQMTFHADGGTTYYFQISDQYSSDGGGEVINFDLVVASPPIASFFFSPSDPTIYDTVQFYNYSYDPGNAGFQTVAWDFGDGMASTDFTTNHKYAKDGDYTVQLSLTTADGRTASTSQVVQVRTHDVTITKLSAPNAANVGQTRTITVSVNSKNYSETVQIDLYRSVVGGWEYVGSVTQNVPARASKRTVTYSFSYKFTNADASIGKVSFYAVATIPNARDGYPADNEAYSSPPTKVNKR